MPFIPNELDAFHPSQAAPDSGDLEILVAGEKATGVVSGGEVTAQGTPDMTVAVATGVIAVEGTKVNVAAGNVTITAADGTDPRIDLIVVSSAGAKSAVAGTPAPEMDPPTEAGPVFPAIPASSVVLAAVYVPAADTDIDANQITDKRVFVIPPEPTTNYDLAKARDIPLVKERSQTVTLDTGQNEVHSSALVGDRLFCGTRRLPWNLIRFNNLNDLTDRTVLTAPNDPNHDRAESMVYVEENNRLYIAGNRTSRMAISEVNPDTMTETLVINEVLTFGQGSSPALASDGDHLYILTFNTTSKIYKYRLSDYVQVASVSLTGRANGHAMIYDGEYLYAGGSQWVAKVNPADLTYVDAVLPQTGQVTDDGICSVGDYIFVGQEAGTVEQVHRIEKDSLTTAVASGIGDVDTYALHFDGEDVWHVGPGTPGTVRRINPKTLAIQSYTMASGENDPSEIVTDGAGRLLVAFFLSPAKVKRFFPLPTGGLGLHEAAHRSGGADALSHDNLGGVSADDHHAQSHTHASHTSIGANDHHNQAHGTADHTPVTLRVPVDLRNPRVTTLAGNSFFTVTGLTALDLGHWVLDNDVEGRIYGVVAIPKNVHATPNAKIILSIGANATSGVTRLQVSTKAIADGESMNPASLTAETAQDITVPGTARFRKDVTFPTSGSLGETVAADDLLLVEITHLGAHANDTLAVDTELVAAFLQVDV